MMVVPCAWQEDEGPLLRYLETARGPLGEPLFDAHNALRLCRARGRVKVSKPAVLHDGFASHLGKQVIWTDYTVDTPSARVKQGWHGLLP